MKKLLSLFLCAALLLASVSAFAGSDASIDFQDRLQLRGTLPDGYKCTILQHRDYRLVNSDCSKEFQPYLRHLRKYRTTR